MTWYFSLFILNDTCCVSLLTLCLGRTWTYFRKIYLSTSIQKVTKLWLWDFFQDFFQNVIFLNIFLFIYFFLHLLLSFSSQTALGLVFLMKLLFQYYEASYIVFQSCFSGKLINITSEVTSYLILNSGKSQPSMLLGKYSYVDLLGCFSFILFSWLEKIVKTTLFNAVG